MIAAVLRTVAVLAILATGTQIAGAQWSASQKEEFNRVCEQSCRRNDKVPDAQKNLCIEYCSCVADGGEKVAPDYDRLNRDFADNKDTEEVKAFRGLVPGCNARAFR